MSQNVAIIGKLALEPHKLRYINVISFGVGILSRGDKE